MLDFLDILVIYEARKAHPLFFFFQIQKILWGWRSINEEYRILKNICLIYFWININLDYVEVLMNYILYESIKLKVYFYYCCLSMIWYNIFEYEGWPCILLGSCSKECTAIMCSIRLLDLGHDRVVSELRLKIMRI